MSVRIGDSGYYGYRSGRAYSSYYGYGPAYGYYSYGPAYGYRSAGAWYDDRHYYGRDRAYGYVTTRSRNDDDCDW